MAEIVGPRRGSLALLLLALYVLVGGVTSFVAWYADVPRLADWLGTGISIQPNAAIAVISAGIGLLLFRFGFRRVAGAVGVFVFAIGATVLIEYATDIDFGVDRLFLFDRRWGAIGVLSPGRMGPSGALSWTMLGLAMLFASSSPAGRWPRAVAPALALCGITMSSLTLLGYLYGVTALYTVPTVTVIALQTSTFILATAIGVVVAVPDRAPMRIVTDSSPAGALVRRILPAVIVVPIVLGLLRLWGEQGGWYGLATGTAARTMAEIALMSALLWWAAAAIGKQAEERRQTESRLLESLREADRRKNEFLATLAHELRNPLAPLRNAAELMKLKAPEDRVLMRASSVIERQVLLMARLLDDLLDIGRITSDKLELRRERVDLATVLRDAVEMCRPLVQQYEHDLTFVAREPIAVDADPARLGQVFGNLLNNACKYTERNGRISVMLARDRDDAVVTVSDTGIGIPADKLTSIFDMFSQVDRVLNRPHGGLGIGLHLVKRLVELHGGSVAVQSEGPGHGSQFTVRIPALPAASAADAPEAPAPIAVTPVVRARRILIVDDNIDHADSLAMLLSIERHEVHAVHDGIEALAAADRVRPDVVLLDLGMPRLDGFDTCRRLREQPWGKSMLLVAITGWGQDADRIKSSEAGFDYHLVKPIDSRALTAIVNDVSTAGSGV
jgi:signal transduction histidine kinase/ActR/RegA family two-component response regulator